MSVSFRASLMLFLSLTVTVPAVAQSEALRKAIELFDAQQYAAAQQALQGVARDKLSDAEQTQLDHYLSEAPAAIAGSEQAGKDSSAAKAAYESGNWDEAERLSKAVLDNKYASAKERRSASDRITMVTSNRDSRPVETVRVTSVTTTVQEAPSPAPRAETTPGPMAAPVEGQRETVVDQMRKRDELNWQRAEAQAERMATEARDAVSKNDFTSARQAAQNAIQTIEAAKIYAEPASRYEAAKAAAEALRQEVEDAYREYSAAEAAREREAVKNRIEEKTRLQEKKRQETIEQLFNSAKQLRKEQRYTEAAEMLRQVLILDPSNAKAKDQLEVALDYATLRDQQKAHDDYEDQIRRSMIDAEETKIPWQHEVLYPDNWLQLSEKRARAGMGVSGESGENREMNRKLDEILPEIRFQDQPFENVVEFLVELKGVNLNVDWEDLEANGVEKDKTVTIKLNNLPFRVVLRELLTQVGGDVRLAYQVTEGLIKIATKEKLDRDKNILVYDINDLLVNVPRFTNAANLNPAQALNQAGQGGQGGGGGGGQLFEDNEQGGEGAAGEGGAIGGGGGRTQIVQEIIDIIRQTVEPESWRDTGAGDGSIRELNGQLIVYNTSDAHRAVEGLLDQLRAFRALQIAVETRFLTVSSNYLEEIGVDLDFVFNSGSAGFDQAFSGAGVPLVDPFTGASVLVPRTFNQIGSLPTSPAFGNPLTNPFTGGLVNAAPTGIANAYGLPGLVPANGGIFPHVDELTPLPMRNSSLNLVDPANFSTGVPGSWANRRRNGANPALSIAGSFLDNLQVDFLIRATQANSRTSVVQAPRLILFNGQRSNIFVGRTQTYVASLQPQIAQQAAAFAPVIGAAQSGSSLDVEATISADRRYVTVTVQTQRADDPVLTRFEIQRASGNAPGAFITNVDQQSAAINTTVSIPDGGTVMLGGLKLAGEVEVEAGVPILSKIPILKRAFTNTTTIKDTQTLLILVKAKIIIQKEAEEEAFPTLTSAGGI